MEMVLRKPQTYHLTMQCSNQAYKLEASCSDIISLGEKTILMTTFQSSIDSDLLLELITFQDIAMLQVAYTGYGRTIGDGDKEEYSVQYYNVTLINAQYTLNTDGAQNALFQLTFKCEK